MHITQIELENIKSHRHTSLRFERGTTAIVGHNGAGKTTIIEAVAWTLFDVLDYSKDDFVTRGEKKGTAKVSFISNLDEREYIVVRDTATAYYVQDPLIKKRIANKKEEVTRFLWQHLGVEPGTDLSSLFREAIGVPQGTLTVIFKATPAQRKVVFDTLLKVDEYRDGAQKLRATRDYINNQIQSVRVRIANSEGQLARHEEVEELLGKLQEQFEALNSEVATLDKEAEEKKEAVKVLDTAAANIASLSSAFEKSTGAKSRAELVLGQKESEVRRAREAAELVDKVRADHERHLKAVGMLMELERERAERERLGDESRRIETAEIRLKSDRKRFTEELAEAQGAATEIKALRPKVSEQEKIEAEIQRLKDSISEARGKQKLADSLDKDIARLRDDYKKNQADIKKAEDLVAAAGDFKSLRTRDEEVTRELTRLRAQLEYDEKFQKEIKGGLCPILSAKCLNLKEDETLEGFLKNQFAELKTRIGGLEAEQKSLSGQLKSAQGAERAAGTLAALRENEQSIAAEGKRLASDKEKLAAEMPDPKNTQIELEAAEKELGALDDPRSKVRVLERESAREGGLREKLAEVEKNLERLDTDKKELAEKLSSYRDLDENWRQYSSERDTTLEGHQEFIRNEADAAKLSECETALTAAKDELERISAECLEVERDLRYASAGYDAATHDSERAALIDADRRLTAARTNLSNTQSQKKNAEDELARLGEVRKTMRGEQQELERLNHVGEVTDFIRDTLKEAAPRIARNYVHHVALEANQMFREITGNAERTLKWTEDYGIQLEEDGHDRPFGNLSGGEQMSAALSVRLALLKQLSDIKLAFFDEPTTNMDAERRERLAEQVSQITQKQTFDQLFIISHDDTFEHYVDNVLTVGDD